MTSAHLEVFDVDPYKVFRAWWGDELSESSVAALLSEPVRRQADFIDFYRQEAGRSDAGLPAASGLRPIVQPSSDDLEFGWTAYADRAINLLLYAKQIAMDDPMLYARRFASLAGALNALMKLKPFHAISCVSFIHYPADRYRHPSQAHGLASFGSLEELAAIPGSDELFLEMSRLERLYPDSEVLRTEIFSARSDIGRTLRVAGLSAGSLSPLAVSSMQSVVLQAAILRARDTVLDRRLVQISKLAAVDLPKLNSRGVLEVRRSSQAFADWRGALDAAMERLGNLRDDDPAWQVLARQAMAEEIEPVLEEIRSELEKSSALTALRIGSKSLTYSAIGAATGAALGGNPLASAAGAGAGKVAEVVTEYIRATKRRRANGAMLDLAVTFTDS